NKAIANYTENVISELTEWLNSLPNTDGTAEEIWAKEGRKLSKLVANWLINRLFSHLNESKLNIKECKITPENFAEFIAFVHQGKISKLTAQDIMKEMFETGNDPETIIQEKNLGQMDNSDELSSVVDKIIANNPKAIEDIKAGKEASIKFLMGQIMKETKGKANPQIISDLLIQKLK
ncbi:MAG: Asp-tRNA(Asn)/Glu-tRNA(Gln) amidotransferase subunit GatB, partial [bacterium]